MIMEQLLTTEELAKRMRVNPSTVRRWRLDDVGPPYLRVGTVYRYPVSAVEA
jgi:excisionase family DNA binding protein